MNDLSFSEIIKFVLNNNGSAFFYTPPIYKKAVSYLFASYSERIKITSDVNISNLLNSVDKKLTNNYCYSMLNYELGYLLEPKLNKFINPNTEFGEFIFFDKKNVTKIKSKNIIHNLFFPAKKIKPVKNLNLNTTKKEYIHNINKIKKYIEEGETYQVNYTVKAYFTLKIDVDTLINIIIFMQSAKYMAIINTGKNIIISLSPELFFKHNQKKISVLPMKGTITRGFNIYEDKINYNYLLNSEKEKAENLMIVDLMRNDLGKFAEIGSVKVKKLFKIEKYETLFQMISIIKAKVNNPSISNILKNIFPCGSITGAPKLRTIEIIKEIEKEERGIYTGAIGFIAKNKYEFNVAIRTLVIDKENEIGLIGLGGGIVWDGIPQKEFDEVKLKAAFLTKQFVYFELFESFLVENKKVYLLNEHLKRLNKAADYFLFICNTKEIIKRLNAFIAASLTNEAYKVKLVLNKWGNIKFEYSKIEQPLNNIKIIISNKQINSKNNFQYFKTTNRSLYNNELKKCKAKGFDETIFLNESGYLTEGTYTNLFISVNNQLITPPISAGILNGTYRKELIKKDNKIKEQNISIDDIINSERIFICNSVRKKISVNEVWYNNSCIWKQF